MTGIKPITHRPLTLGDAAVDGLLNGVIAGLAMALFLVLAAFLAGQPFGGVLQAFDISPRSSPLIGLVMHLAVSGVYGAFYGFAWKGLIGRFPVRLPGWLTGLIYGLLLLALAELLLLPASSSPLRDIPFYEFAVAHLIYGAVLGWLVGRLIH